MLVCLCKGVSDRVVRLAIATGAHTVDSVGARCGAGTDCGTCRHAIQDLIEDAGVPAGAESACCDDDSGRMAEPMAASAGA